MNDISPEPQTQSCPDCGGFGYFEDGTDDGVECETCHGNGVIKASSLREVALIRVRP